MTAASHRLARARRLGVTPQMRRVPEAVGRARRSLDADAVHRLRVALRRCRSVSDLMAELDPHPVWSEPRRLSRTLFTRLGVLRDVQVLRQWVTALAADDDPLRATLMATLDRREAKARARARRAIDDFDRRAWIRLAGRLARRAKAVPPDGLAAQCLALQRFEVMHRLHASAVRTARAEPWHQLRVSLKRFRYVVESLLPARLPAWESGLRGMQDLLGWIHDLDVFDAFVEHAAPASMRGAAAALRRATRANWARYRARYRTLAQARASGLSAWRAGLPHGPRIEAAVSARLAATALALTPHPRRAARVTRRALRLFDARVSRGAFTPDAGGDDRRVLHAAATLHAIRTPRRSRRGHRRAAHIVRRLPPPPGWTAARWQDVALVIEVARGGDAAPARGRRAGMARARRGRVPALAGIQRKAAAREREAATQLSTT
jgi:CHAD domain-containing protein